MSITVEVSNLTKNFGSRAVISDISFRVEAGTSLAIMGPSGCGKSTLLNIIGLLESATAGEVRLNGDVLPAVNSRAATRMRRSVINYLFQSFALISDKSAYDNAMLSLHFAQMSKSDKSSRITSIFNRLQLSSVSNDRVFTLSGGEQQRLALARCILKPGGLILADEPTGALDKGLADQVLHEMLALQHEHNKTLIVVTHDPSVASKCDSTLTLNAR